MPLVEDTPLLRLRGLKALGYPLKAAWWSVAGAAAPRRTALLATWFVVVWFAFAGGIRAGLTGLSFALLVLLPAALLVQHSLLAVGVPKILAQPTSGALTLCLVPFLFLLRKSLPLSPLASDVILCLGVGGAAAGFAHFGGVFRPRLPSVSRAEALWLAVVIPAVFLAPRLGNEVHVGDQVRFYGPSLMDFGNLRVVVNLLNIDPHQVPAPVDACGPLVYHWLFFATPAWMSNFLGSDMDAGISLTLVNFTTAILFFRCLSLCCYSVLEKAGASIGQWGPVGACIGVTGASLGYFYSLAGKLMHVPGEQRNQLMLQLTSSMSIFGNNTLALCLVLLGLLALHEWNATHRPAWLVVAVLVVAFVPAMSITLAPSVGLGITFACLAGVIHRRWLALSAFALAAALVLIELVKLEYFTGTHNEVAFQFDNGRFLQNFSLSFPLVAVAATWCLLRQRTEMSSLFGWTLLGALLVPSFIFLAGEPDVPSTMSMKNASLLLACGCPLVTLALSRWFQIEQRGIFTFRNAALALILLGLINSLGYMLATPLTRLGLPIQPSVSISADYFSALQHIRHTTPRTAIVLDPFSVDHDQANPATIFAARRVVLPSAYELTWRYTNDEVVLRQDAWTLWAGSKFTNEAKASELAACADCLVAPEQVKSEHWKFDAQFGKVFVYRSTSQTASTPKLAGS